MNTVTNPTPDKTQADKVGAISTVKKDLEKLAEDKGKPELVSQFNNLLAKQGVQVF